MVHRARQAVQPIPQAPDEYPQGIGRACFAAKPPRADGQLSASNYAQRLILWQLSKPGDYGGRRESDEANNRHDVSDCFPHRPETANAIVDDMNRMVGVAV